MVARTPSSLGQYLPAIYQEDPFLGQFLLAFEKVLLGRTDDVDFAERGLEETIANLASLFDPKQTPDEFLSWLAGWTALSLRADLPPVQQRDFIAKIISLYRRRGTKENLQQLLEIFTISKPAVIETSSEEGAPPHFFRVIVSLPRLEPEKLNRQIEIAKALVELEKPAHTAYKLETIFPSMQIGVHSTVGVDTLLGTVPENPS